MSVEVEQVKLDENIVKYTGGFLNIGDKVNGYVVTEKLNTDSGEAEIYFCEKNSKKYILKYYFKKNFFSDIVEKLKALNHPNVMKILDIGTHNKHWYEIDEYYNGGSLDSDLPLNEEKANKILIQLNEGLKAIHETGLIHRDIKAENIYFTDSTKENVVIGDFGISIVYDQKDGVDHALTEDKAGTEGYRAPEVFNNVVTPSIDYYSLGITFWNLVEGREPFIESSGEPLSSEVIRGKTINEEIVDFLFSNSTNLSENGKKLICGLLTHRHDKRWTYNQTKDFLNGKDVPVYEERKELEPFIFNPAAENPIEFHSLKGIAQEMLNDSEQGYKILEDSRLTLYLDSIGLKEITDKIEKVQSKYFEEKNTDVDGVSFKDEESRKWYALVKCAYILSRDITFPVICEGNRYDIDSLESFRDMLLEHPDAIRPYLKDESKGLYLMLEAKTQGVASSLRDDIKSVVKNAKYDKFIASNIYLSIMGNKIKPFTDKENANIELSSKDDVFALEQHLKDRIMFLIDAKTRLIVAWFENIFEVNLNDWYSELEGGVSHNERIASLRRNKLLAYGKWNYFELFLKGKDVIYRQYYFDNDKIGLLDLDGSILLKAEYKDVNCEFVRNNYIVKFHDEWIVRDFKNQQTLISYPKEINVFNEVDEIYFAQHKTEDRHILLVNSNDSSYEEYKVNCSNTGRIKSLSEKNRPNERYIRNDSELLDSNFSVIDTYNEMQVLLNEGDVPSNLKFWVVKNEKVFVVDKNGNKLADYPYSGFLYVGNNCFVVWDIDDKHSVVDYKNELIQEKIKDYRSSGSIAAIKEGNLSKWKVKNLKDDKWEYNGKKFSSAKYFSSSLAVKKSSSKYFFFGNDRDRVTTTILQKGKFGGKVFNSNGERKNFLALNLKTITELFTEQSEFTNQPKDFSYSTLLGFDGDSFYKYNFGNFTFDKITSLKYVPYEEFNFLMDNVDSKQIVSLVRKSILKKDQKKANEIINLVWEYYYKNGSYDVIRYLLSSIRMDDMEGLDYSFLYYKNRLGNTYLLENERNKNSFTYVQMQRNYNFALHYLLSAAGKEIDENFNIVRASYYSKLHVTAESVFDCARLCVELSQLNEELCLSCKKWTKESLKTLALEFLGGLYSHYTDTDNVDSDTYTRLYDIGLLYRYVDKFDEEVAVFTEGISYEPDSHPINRVQLFVSLYLQKKYTEAINVYKILEEIYPDLDKLGKQLNFSVKVTDVYYECRKNVM